MLWILASLLFFNYLIAILEIGTSELVAYYSENGVHGTIKLKEKISDKIVLVSTSLYTYNSKDTNVQCKWNIRQFPVNYQLVENRCSDEHLGTITVNLESMLGPLVLNKESQFSASGTILSMTGYQGIWMNSILLQLPDGRRACSTLSVADDADLKVAVVKFYGPLYGTVHMFWMGLKGSLTDTLILSDLQHFHKGEVISSEHRWGIYTTDSLSTTKDKGKLQCNALQPSSENLSDLSKKLGSLKAGKKSLYRDSSLELLDLYQNQRTYYLIVYDDVHTDSYLICAPIFLSSPVTLKATIESIGVKNHVTLYQRTPYDVTLVNASIADVAGVGGFRIHELQAKPRITPKYQHDTCDGIKSVYNPTNKGVAAEAHPPATETQDAYAVGDLSGKIGYESGVKRDSFLPLSGQYSVMHRSFVIYRNGEGVEEPWMCGTLLPVIDPHSNVKMPMRTAEVIIRYPLAGRITFRQLSEHTDTVIIAESLVYSDGASLTNTYNHNWTISEYPPGKDYYDWQNRCTSAGSVFDPYKTLAIRNGGSLSWFSFAHLSTTIGPLSIAGEKSNSSEVSRKLLVHPNLHLSGEHSIIGKSLVLYDENGPKARGNRLACSRITGVNRRKAVVRDWFGNGLPASIMGKIEMYQYSEYDNVDVEVDLEGLRDNDQYHIHMVSVEEELEFPCENSTLYEVWNPYNTSENFSRKFDQQLTIDQYKAGDLSGKFGGLSNLTMLDAAFNDSTLQLFGQFSILGRSIVVHKNNNRRWACATIERGYSPSEARELRAIASFHHPLGFAYGYIKMTQLVHIDGSKSDTVIEVSLRHPGKQNRNVTHNHLWMIYVNPVSVDATVSAKHTRCTAGGYIWNPYFTQLADPVNEELYFKECGPDNPLRCYLGDMSGRLGPISIGAERTVFSDQFVSLEGEGSVIGRSVVILDKDFGNDRFACANIEPDKDIIKYANIRKSPNFVPAQFLSDVREILGVPEWMLTADSRKTKQLHGGLCVQFLLHFKGPEANKIELDFSHLMRTGHLASPSLYIPGYVPSAVDKKKQFLYSSCPVGDGETKNRITGSACLSSSASVSLLSVMMLVRYIFII